MHNQRSNHCMYHVNNKSEHAWIISIPLALFGKKYGSGANALSSFAQNSKFVLRTSRFAAVPLALLELHFQAKRDPQLPRYPRQGNSCSPTNNSRTREGTQWRFVEKTSEQHIQQHGMTHRCYESGKLYKILDNIRVDPRLRKLHQNRTWNNTQ